MISVIMSTYREPLRYIKQSTDSILNQSCRDLEFVIIVDDPDNNELIAYLKSLAAQDHRITVSINEKNCGLTESLNRAKRLARGDYIARMDADDISEADRLETQLNYLLEQDYDLVGCNVRDMDENGELLSGHVTSLPTKDRAIKEYLKTNSAILHPTWFAKREIYDLFDYIDFPACEDYEFLVRIALAGKKIGNVREPKLRYRINRESISANKKVIQKTSQYYVRKNYREGKESSIDSFYTFMKSPGGAKKRNDLAAYYKKSANLKQYLHDGKLLHFAVAGLCQFAVSHEARNVVISELKQKLIKVKYEKDY